MNPVLPSRPNHYDFFVSYARSDNASGRIRVTTPPTTQCLRWSPAYLGDHIVPFGDKLWLVPVPALWAP